MQGGCSPHAAAAADAFYFSLFGFVVFASSVAPRNSWRPPLASCFGMRSAKRINLSFLRLRVLLPDAPASAFSSFFGILTSGRLLLRNEWNRSRCQLHRKRRTPFAFQDRIERGSAWFAQPTPNRFDDVDIMFHWIVLSLVAGIDAKPIWRSSKPF